MFIHESTRNTSHREERDFLRIFFSLLDNMPEHRGIYGRWKREEQRAEQSGESWHMPNVWLSDTGYVRTLQNVQKYFSRDGFGSGHILQVAGLAVRVVQRREAEYWRAAAKGKADGDHLKVLEEWKRVKKTLDNKTSRVVPPTSTYTAISEGSRVKKSAETPPTEILILVFLLAIAAWIIFAGKQ